jgi:DNA-3-methyladenine glycosylase
VALIPREFFARHSVPVAPELLGCVIEHQTVAGLVAVELTEVEAYAGASDPASHAYRGKTARNAVMFGPPGHAYVYFTYGMHFCVNLVCLGNSSASAVLLRAGRVIEGEELARARRTGGPRGVRGGGEPHRERRAISFRDLARGPARLCQALDIDRSQDGVDVCIAESPLRMRWPEAGTTAHSEERKIASGPRVGVSSAAEVPWRFWIEGEPTVSPYRPATPRRRGVPGGSSPRGQQSANWLPPSDPSMAPCSRGRHYRRTLLARPDRGHD